MINESMRRAQVLSDPDSYSAEELGEAGKECLEINSWMLSAANQQACITMSKITELLGAKARGQDDGPKENVLNTSQVMNTVTTDVDKLAQAKIDKEAATVAPARSLWVEHDTPVRAPVSG